MTTASLFPQAPDISADDYCVFGLATCFLRDDGEIRQVQVVEPIPSAALEAIIKGIPTSYECASGLAVGDVVAGEQLALPTGFPSDASFCENFQERALAATRSYKNRVIAKEHIPLGSTKSDFNFSTERKRVLNTVNEVSTEDNVKQHSHTHKVL